MLKEFERVQQENEDLRNKLEESLYYEQQYKSIQTKETIFKIFSSGLVSISTDSISLIFYIMSFKANCIGNSLTEF